MAETTPSSPTLLRIRPMLAWLGQAFVLGYLTAGLTAMVSAPLMGLNWLQLSSIPPLKGLVLASPDQTYFNFLYFIGLIFLASGFWIFSIRRHLSSGLAYGVFSASIGIVLGLLFDLFTTRQFVVLWTLSLALAGGSLIELVLLFPSEDPIIPRFPWLKYAGYAFGLTLAALSAPQLNRVFDLTLIWMVSIIFVGAGLIFALAWTSFRRLRIARSNEREQIRMVLLGMLLGFGPCLLWLAAWAIIPTFFGYPVIFSPLVVLPVGIFPILCSYAVQRYRLVQTDYVLSQASLYAVLAIFVAVGYALLVGGLGMIFTSVIPLESPFFTGLIIFLIALAIQPLRQNLQNLIDSVFFRGQRAYQEQIQEFSGELTNLVDLKLILQTLRKSLATSLKPVELHIFVYDPLSDQYSTSVESTGSPQKPPEAPGPWGVLGGYLGGTGMSGQNRPSSDLRFSSSSSLVSLLSTTRYPLFLGKDSSLPASLNSEKARLTLLGAQLFAPLSGRQRLTGWLALGQRISGEPYSSRDLAFLDALCDQAALAIERAQVVVNLETRVRETNTLAKVAQGVNITLTLDDSLELIYAQTTQVIPADDFHVMLTHRDNGQLWEVFYVSDDERFPEYENKPAVGGSPLEDEIIRRRGAILTDDYKRECQKRGILSNRPNIFGWMCVPLNAGAETIGTVSLGKHDPANPYTREQMQLLQAIADQVAGAIVKMRLLQETERRARQLASLNEVTRQLTSTLELEPLLNNILKSAVEILNCEAGSLLLVDETNQDLVFRATAGPVAGNLLNTHLPAGTGLAGKSVTHRSPVIANDVQATLGWSAQTDRITGFVTRAILVIPLIVKDTVTGVIEVINKKDGSNFTEEDQQLLSTFAAQSSVAVENARQFTVTDLALSARVEELSVMQRIDRELNTSLDVATTMKITLEWAMRQSGAAAGLIGTIQEDHLRIMASQGYGSELDAFPNGVLPIQATSIATVVQSGTPRRFSASDTSSHAIRLLSGAASQLALPIQRETETIGVMLIEDIPARPLSDENLGFLQRLCDHASIAISNAQFYAAVQAANVAKSEFVSFVAHELKNPMTSIKGYTELLAVQAVGPVNEAQANFLSTIRSNIERMNTLVSDLNDVSKIEAGRLRLDFKALPLSVAVDDIVRSTRRQLEEKGQKLELQIPADLPNVWSDRTRLAQVLVNLVSNAHKYTQQGGQILVGAEVGANHWDSTGAARVVHIWVRDNGIGIAQEDQKKIFQKFFRSEDPKTREVPGTGLGLNITRSLIEMQGGRIWFESEFRKGTTFHFTVPVAE